MKKEVYWLLISAVALSIGACKKKEAAKTTEPSPVVAEVKTADSPVDLPEVKAPIVSAEERAAKLGFVRHLPADTEIVLSLYNGTKTMDRMKSSKLWKFIAEQMNMGAMGMGVLEDQEMEALAEEAARDGIAPEAASPESEGAGPTGLFATEFTLALGKPAAGQTANLLTLNRRMGYLQMRSAVQSLVEAVKSGDADAVAESFASSYDLAWIDDLVKDPQAGLELFEKFQMPPIYCAFKTRDSDHEVLAQQVAAMVENLSFFENLVEPIEVENPAGKFQGFKMLGSKIAAMIEEDREDIDDELGAVQVSKLLEILTQKNIVIMSGTVGDYVVLFIGSSEGDLKFSSDVNSSLVATEALVFTDSYMAKDLAILTYGEKEGMDTMIRTAGGFADMADGLRDGIADSEVFGDTRDLEAMLQIIVEREAALLSLTNIEALGMVGFFEDGLKIESFGGSDSGMMDWKSPNKLAHLGNADHVLFVNFTADAAFDAKARAYYEALFETSYAMTMKFAELPISGEKMTQFKQMAMMFDEKFQPDMVGLWDALSNDLSSGLGEESALIVDLNGSAPAIPGLPQQVVDKAKVPRVSLIAPITDRAKIAASWDKVNTTLIGTFAKIGEITGQVVPMQKPLSSEKNGQTTWFFPLPFFNADFLPSITLGDQWFVASSSKNQALDLIAQAGNEAAPREGFWVSINFKALQKYASETYTVADDHAETLMGAPLTESQKKNLKKAIATLDDLDRLTVHSRRESGMLRSSLHWKTR